MLNSIQSREKSCKLCGQPHISEKKEKKKCSWLKRKPFNHKELSIYQLHSSLNQYKLSKKNKHTIRFTDNSQNHSTSRISIKKSIDEVKIPVVTGSNKLIMKKKKKKQSDEMTFEKQEKWEPEFPQPVAMFECFWLQQVQIIFNKPSTIFKKSLILDRGIFLLLQLFCIHMFQASLQKSIFSLNPTNEKLD